MYTYVHIFIVCVFLFQYMSIVQTMSEKMRLVDKLNPTRTLVVLDALVTIFGISDVALLRLIRLWESNLYEYVKIELSTLW